MAIPEPFGPRLRAMRVARGLSLSEFARRTFYSKGHVSRIETGVARPSVEFAQRCDAELAADGALAALVRTTTASPAAVAEDDNDDGMWIMTMSPDGSSFVPLGRRELLMGGAMLLSGLAVTRPAAAAGEVHLGHHTAMLASAREIGQTAHPQAVLPIVVGQAQALRLLAEHSQGADAKAVAALSSRTAEFAGWMAQEAGDERMAMWWTQRAVRAAEAAGDTHTAAYALVRQALITMYNRDHQRTIALAKQAQSVPGTPSRILGLAAQREAQGHALAGDHTECMRALDRARAHLEAAEDGAGGPVIGTSHVPDPVAAATGWCLYDLGKPAAAAAALDREVVRINPGSARARARFGVRQALAHAAAGDVARACALAGEMLGHAALVNSATIRTDLNRLAATLRRSPRHPDVVALGPSLAAALHPGEPGSHLA
ncbi:helix-turn-helix transcriptional regulator [Actinokineospora sp. NBRC 105648]|uniref:helix-turn-helix domain-containing protein n=1 Tax=Actinokineospora sp. NBRC 105648 TaxID=3032206 RepID=UPI0024A3B4F9|nr:helix-turn-helix transcriptional regulator [Actinokineospora sp. NBRC 105648]GLZ43597.1 transcriptional regulator [Actinokineospora sp. NBRC 105648]